MKIKLALVALMALSQTMDAYDFTTGRGIGSLVKRVKTLEEKPDTNTTLFVHKIESVDPHKIKTSNTDGDELDVVDLTPWLKEPELKKGVLDFNNKKITLTLENGKTVDVDLTSLIDEATKKVVKDIAINGTELNVTMTSGEVIHLTTKDDFVTSLNWDKDARVLKATRIDGEVLELSIPSDDSKINDLSKDDDAHTLTVTKGDTNTTLNLDSWVKNFYAESGTLDLDAKKLTISVNGSPDVVIDVTSLSDKLADLKSGFVGMEFKDSNRTLTLTDANGVNKEVDLSTLFQNWFITNGDLMLDDGILRLERSEGSNIDVNITELKDILNELGGNATRKKVLDLTVDNLASTILIEYTDETNATINLTELNATQGVRSVDFKAPDTLVVAEQDGTTKDINLSSLFADKVDKVVGKGLSTNDLTDTLKTLLESKKIADMREGANDTLDINYTDGTTDTLTLYDNAILSGVLSLDGKKLVLTDEDENNVSVDFTELIDLLNETTTKVDVIKVKDIVKSGDTNLTISMTDDTTRSIDLSGLLDNINVADGSLSMTDKKVTLTKSDGSTIDIDFTAIIDKVNGDVEDVDINTTSNRLVVSFGDGTKKDLDLGTIVGDVKLSSGQLVTVDKKLSLTLTDGNVIDVDMSLLTDHLLDFTNPHQVTKAQIGLDNVDNTSDADKNISTKTQSALNRRVMKVTGKELSTNDFTDALKDAINLKKVKDVTLNNDDNIVVAYTDNSTSELVLPSGNNLQDAIFDNANQKIILDMKEGSNIEVNLADLYSSIGDKVDKELGKGLSTNDFTNALKTIVEAKKVKNVEDSGSNKITITFTDDTTTSIDLAPYAKSAVFSETTNKLTITRFDNSTFDVTLSAFNNKVDKAAGKGLTTNDFTNDYKNKVDVVKVKTIIGDNPNNRLVVTDTNDAVSYIAIDSLITDDVADSGSFDLTAKKLNIHNSDSTNFDVDFTSLVDALNNKIDKVGGKGLTTNDLTNALKALIEADRMIDVVPDDVSSATKLTLKFRDGTDKLITMAKGGDKLTSSTLDDGNKKITNTLESGATVDTDLTTLYNKVDGKEPSFSKNSAFNKNFGTSSSTVAKGNHTHAQLHTHANKAIIDKFEYANDQLEYDGERVDQQGTIIGKIIDFANWSEAVTFVNTTLKNKKIVGSDLVLNIASSDSTASDTMYIYGVGDAEYSLIIKGAGETSTIAKRSGTSPIIISSDSFVVFQDMSISGSESTQYLLYARNSTVKLNSNVKFMDSKATYAIKARDSLLDGDGVAMKNVKTAIYGLENSTILMKNMDYISRTDETAPYGVLIGGSSYAELSGLTFDGKEKVETAVKVEGSSSCILYDGTITNFTSNGIYVSNSSFEFKRSTVNTTSSASTRVIHAHSNAHVIADDVTISDVSIAIRAETSSDITLTNSTMTSIATIGVVAMGNSNVDTSNNTFQGTPVRWIHNESSRSSSIGDSYDGGTDLLRVHYSGMSMLKNTTLANISNGTNNNFAHVVYGGILETWNQTAITSNIPSDTVEFDGRRIR